MDRYMPHHRLRDLLADNPLLLPALSRFGISLGFGDSAVSTVCNANGVDTDTFLTVANFISGNTHDKSAISLRQLIEYLRSAHSYFIEYRLPAIRRQLVDTMGVGVNADIALAIMKFFDEYAADVVGHMEFENDKVFSYVEGLLAGTPSADFRIADFKEHHGPIDAKLKEIKEILICHFTADKSKADMLNSLLFDVVVCERDLVAHCKVEDELFVPAVERLERHIDAMVKSNEYNDPTSSDLDENGDITLTPRERDIIRAVAAGKSNKEIADALCLSVHTVTTHRRNISAKLNIHTTSGLIIYAIIHNLITLDDVRPLIQK